MHKIKQFLWKLELVAILLLVSLVASGQTSMGPTTRPEENARQKAYRLQMERERQEFRQYLERLKHPISLAEDVSFALDGKKKHNQMVLGTLFDQYGAEVVLCEAIKQSEARKSNGLCADILFVFSDYTFECLRDLAFKSLDSKLDYDYKRQAGIEWCFKHPKLLNEEQQKKVARLFRKEFEESPHTWIGYMEDKATPQDLPLVRRVYAEISKAGKIEINSEPADDSAYSLYRPGATRSKLLLLMAKLGDLDTRRQIIQSIKQKEDVQKRVWGMMMVSRLNDKKLLEPVAAALEDNRQVPDAIGEYVDPEDRKQHIFARYVFHTRCCDYALRTIHDMFPPPQPWAFEVPPSTHLSIPDLNSDLRKSYSFSTNLEKEWNAERGLRDRNILVGFSEEQLGIARKYAADLQKGATTQKSPK